MPDALTHLTHISSLRHEVKSHSVGLVGEMRQARQVRQAEPLTETLARLAVAVQRLSPSHRDPERFHEDKAEVVGELRALARKVRS